MFKFVPQSIFFYNFELDYHNVWCVIFIRESKFSFKEMGERGQIESVYYCVCRFFQLDMTMTSMEMAIINALTIFLKAFLTFIGPNVPNIGFPSEVANLREHLEKVFKYHSKHQNR